MINIYYLYNLNTGSVYKIALFEFRISDEHIQFLQHHDCLPVWMNNNILEGPQGIVQFS